MKKIVSILTVAISLVACADYMLYWDTQAYTGTIDDGDYAQLYFTSAESTAGKQIGTLYYQPDDSSHYIIGATDLGSSLEEYTDGYFYIDIWSRTKDSSAPDLLYDGFDYNNLVSYQSLIEANAIREIGGEGGHWSFGAVPEPTGGMLVLVGLALLGLRRKGNR